MAQPKVNKSSNTNPHLKKPNPASKRPKGGMKVSQDAVYATGRRKESAARSWIMPNGKGNVQVNGRTLNDYFCRDSLKMMVNQPFEAVEASGRFDVFCTVRGGGTTGQAQAIRHGIARALVEFDETFKSKLRAAGLLTRDSREVERKKYGLKKARKKFQFSKR